ncbi:predicted protein [Plenodomus lingam JN3]|uniref:Predicted protein n=1 Tax=Leptosphaeria maculans (strain JN3 / isolate v23.1.3 / race Av1-4-5-6-7-8) TaxID=985895 RepID=E4ZQE5_LEPMJ|nr:predicted protein [Plenodomus lingam JN3]CBX93620.1 predicted protein [Plenodomus lingam JN3]
MYNISPTAPKNFHGAEQQPKELLLNPHKATRKIIQLPLAFA